MAGMTRRGETMNGVGVPGRKRWQLRSTRRAGQTDRQGREGNWRAGAADGWWVPVFCAKTAKQGPAQGIVPRDSWGVDFFFFRFPLIARYSPLEVVNMET